MFHFFISGVIDFGFCYFLQFADETRTALGGADSAMWHRHLLQNYEYSELITLCYSGREV